MRARIASIPFPVCLLLFILSSLAYSQYQVWSPESGVVVRQGYQIRDNEVSSALGPDGSSYIAWTDARMEYQDVYVQRYNPDGIPVWTDGGLAITRLDFEQRHTRIAGTEDGGCVVVWYDARYDTIETNGVELFVQWVSPDGEPLWEDNGVTTHEPGVFAVHYSLMPTVDNDMILVTALNNDNLRFRRYDESGTVVWEENLSFDNPGATLYSDGNSGVICSWYYDNAYYFIKVSADGEVAWSEGITLPVNSYLFPEFCGDLNGGVFFSYIGEVSDYLLPVIIGHLDTSGELEVDTVSYLECDSPTELRSMTGITCTDPSNIFISFILNTTPFDGLYVQNYQRVENTFELQWTSSFPELTYTEHFRMIASENGDLLVGFNERYSIYHSFILTCFDSEGDDLWQVTEEFTDYSAQCHLLGLATPASIAVFGTDEINGLKTFTTTLYSSDAGNILNEGNRVFLEGLDRGGLSPVICANRQDVFTAWTDERYEESIHTIPFVQKQDMENGVGQWEANGVCVAPEIINSENRFNATDIEIATNSSGGVDVLWTMGPVSGRPVDVLTGVWVQKLDADGNLLWGDSGIELPPDEDMEYTHVTHGFIGSVEEDNLVLFYQMQGDQQNGSIRMQVLNEQGESIWQEPFGRTIIASLDSIRLEAVQPTGDGNYIMVYSNLLEDDNTYLKAIKLDHEANWIWEEPADLFYEYQYYYPFNVQIIEAGPNTIISACSRHSGFLHCQIVDESGGPMFEQSETILSETTSGFQYCIAPHSDQTFWYISEERNYLPEAQVLDFDFQPIDDNPIVLGETPVQDDGLTVQSDGQGGVYIFWKYYHDYTIFSDYRFVHLTNQRTLATDQYTLTGLQATTALYEQRELNVCSDGSGGVVAVYEDIRANRWHQPYSDHDIYTMRINDYIVNANNPDTPAQPLEFTLYPAYPNPFNPSVTVPYLLGRRAFVRISIFNLVGRQVTTLVNGQMRAGYHTAVWQGDHQHGIPVASGIYFVQMEVDGNMNTERVILLR